MDRLSAVALVAVALGLAGCAKDRSGSDKAPPSRQRVNAVAAKPGSGPNLDEFCEVRASASEAETFTYPELAVDSGPRDGWRWINVWATWCKPCVSELPMLADWREQLGKDDVDIDLVFLSVDGDEATVQGFRETHAEIPESLRISDPKLLPQWLTSLGLDESGVLPIHLFVDPSDKLRCVRMGELSKSDYAMVKKLVAKG